MSWMDSWSRPTKHAATPPPLYLTPGGDKIPYCHTCGRVISTRKSQPSRTACTPVKYCSDRCRHNKPSQAPDSPDHRILATFVALLDGKPPSPGPLQDPSTSADPPPSKSALGSQKKKVKGETRITVACDEVEALCFGARHDPEKAFGRKKNRAPRGMPEPKEWKSVDMEDKPDAPDLSQTDPSDLMDDPPLSTDSEPDTKAVEHVDMISLRVRPPQSQSDVNGSVGGEKGWAEKTEETPEMLRKRLEGQKRAEEREMVRCVARRLCAFGVGVDDHLPKEEAGKEKRTGVKGKGKWKDRGKEDSDRDDDGPDGQKQGSTKKCEAVMKGSVVEASFAKGEWGVRWRE